MHFPESQMYSAKIELRDSSLSLIWGGSYFTQPKQRCYHVSNTSREKSPQTTSSYTWDLMISAVFQQNSKHVIWNFNLLSFSWVCIFFWCFMIKICRDPSAFYTLHLAPMAARHSDLPCLYVHASIIPLLKCQSKFLGEVYLWFTDYTPLLSTWRVLHIL